MVLVSILAVLPFVLIYPDVHIAVFSLISNLICFLVSVCCHWAYNELSALPNFHIYFRMDYVGIVLYFWATLTSVILVEIGNHGIYKNGHFAHTMAGLITAVCLLLSPLSKKARTGVIDGFVSLTLLGLILLVISDSRLCQLTVS